MRWEVGGLAQSPAPASLERAFARFHGAAFPHPTPVTVTSTNGGTLLAPILSVAVRDASAPLQLGVSEAYQLDVPAASAGGNITITADTQVGVFRALETLAQLVDFRGAYSEAVVEFEDLVHGALQDDPEQIELLQTVLDKWEQVGEELEFEDPDDEIDIWGRTRGAPKGEGRGRGGGVQCCLIR